jgi:hypothetical protein
VTDLTGGMAHACEQLSIDNQTSANASAQVNINQVIHTLSYTIPPFAKDSSFGPVCDMDSAIEALCQKVPQRDISPGKVRAEADHT